MSTRILHCSSAIENYNICIEQKVAGFQNRGPQPGDLVYLAAKVGKKTLCGARFKLDKLTDLKPWPDGEKYVHSLKVKEVEYCQPFDISILSQTGGKFWSLKYIQASKPISDKPACDLLDQEFSLKKTDHFIPFNIDSDGDNDTANFVVEDEITELAVKKPLTRDSIKVQALLAEIGDRMGYKIWLPKNDRSRVLEVWQTKVNSVLQDLPLNYDSDTLNTIENIDVLWIKGRSIVRAFEVEHTTSIYSGILRMADLMALQPNLNIKAHIVAPIERKEKVMNELSRPVFKHVLAPSCSFISYDSIEGLSKEKMLEYMTDAVLEAFSESVKDSAI
ncbi:hypothetical protein DXT99_24215 [Pontibacter diazotrophicus]|uniref:EVE domain-containing protein n=1 Tax=Pontibacter diazotrophicus TaxID=1400979 RepID=A0A3D8L3D9_9BACT|nr:hypothetical protein [Pontibacter diazotrophicus]RDV11787.1 hypothetical protein DXT99_24215 [Pontibacter diazotrophicus]